MRSAGLSTMRRGRWRQTRRLIFTGAGAAALIICATLAWRNPAPKVQLPANPPQLAEARTASPAPELTDDELLRQFPPGTCTLAEMDGQKTLVFLTDEAQANYLR